MLIASIVVDCVPRLCDWWIEAKRKEGLKKIVIREINIFRECVYNLRWRGCESPVLWPRNRGERVFHSTRVANASHHPFLKIYPHPRVRVPRKRIRFIPVNTFTTDHKFQHSLSFDPPSIFHRFSLSQRYHYHCYFYYFFSLSVSRIFTIDRIHGRGNLLH